MGLHAKSCYQTTKALPTSKKADVLQLESQLLHAILPSSATKPPEAHHPVFFFFLVFGVCWFVGFCLFGFLFVLGNTLNFSLYRKTVPSPSPAFSNWDWIILQMSLKKTKPSFTVKNGNYFLKLFQRLPSHMQILITYPPSWPAQTRNTCIQRNRLLW